MAEGRKSPPRDLAVRILTRVLSDATPLDEALESLGSSENSDSRAWLQEVCSGTLRWRGRLDQAIDSVSLKKKPSGWLRKVLLISVYQLIAQDRTLPAAVVSETVDLVRKKEGDAPSKFANALLRKIADHAQSWRAWEYPKQDDFETQAHWASLPDWLWKKLVKDYGLEWAQKFAQTMLDRPSLWLRAHRTDWQPEGAMKGPIPGSWQAQSGGSVTSRSGFGEGEFIIQDISSQILISEITKAVPKGKVLDLCAAPGGKSIGMAWNGFSVTASDSNPARLDLLRSTLNRVQADVTVVSPDQIAGTFDLVWVDAPCTGSGILRRHPDVRWLRKEKDLHALGTIQEDLIRQAWERVKPGGHLVYSVCSVLKQEGIERIKRAELDSHIAQQWLLEPHSEPFGDGFWGVLLGK